MHETPFFANTADDMHYVQAAFAMILKAFMPERNFSYDKLDELSKNLQAKVPGGFWW